MSSRIEAELIVGLLRSHGLRQEPQWQLDGVHVLVPVSDEQTARELLATVDDGIGPMGRG